MALQRTRGDVSVQTLRKLALRHPGTEEGVACAGTALESRTVRAGKRAFLFLRPGELRLKLRESLPEAAKLASKDSNSYSVGANGWVKAAFDAGGVPLDTLAKWIDESYRLIAGGTASEDGQKKARAKKKSVQKGHT